jgi:hypothetical protein
LALWSDNILREFNPFMRESDELESMKSNKEGLIEQLKVNYKENLAKTMPK